MRIQEQQRNSVPRNLNGAETRPRARPPMQGGAASRTAAIRPRGALWDL